MESCGPCFYCLISKGAAGPIEGKKRATPSSKTGKKSGVSTKSKSEYCSFLFVFFYCKSVGIYILELMH